MKKKNMIIISVIAGIISFLFAVLIFLMVFNVISNSDSEEISTVVSDETDAEPQSSTEDFAEDDNDSVFAEKPENSYSETTRESEKTPTNENIYEPLPSQTSDTTLIDNGIYVVDNTPGGAGVVMRSAATSSSEKIGVLPEGSRVYVYSDDSSNNTGYVKVRTMDEIADRNCYVLKKYLRFECMFPSGSGDNNYGDYYYVSYSTPNHGGINLRSEPSSTSELICLISEGEQLKVIGSFNSQVNGYVKVAYDHPHAGQVFEGWVLATYLTS